MRNNHYHMLSSFPLVVASKAKQSKIAGEWPLCVFYKQAMAHQHLHHVLMLAYKRRTEATPDCRKPLS